jgi:hypothetical protein
VCGESRMHGVEWGKSPRLYQRLTYHYRTAISSICSIRPLATGRFSQSSSTFRRISFLMLAFLISPMGLPMLAVQGLGKLQDVNSAMKNFIHS